MHLISSKIIFEVLCAVDLILDGKPLTLVFEVMCLSYMKVFATLFSVRTHTRAVQVRSRSHFQEVVGGSEALTLCLILRNIADFYEYIDLLNEIEL